MLTLTLSIQYLYLYADKDKINPECLGLEETYVQDEKIERSQFPIDTKRGSTPQPQPLIILDLVLY